MFPQCDLKTGLLSPKWQATSALSSQQSPKENMAIVYSRTKKNTFLLRRVSGVKGNLFYEIQGFFFFLKKLHF